MAEKKSGPTSDLLIFLLIIVGLGVLWFATGGPERAGSGQSLSIFTAPYAPSVTSGKAGYSTFDSIFGQATGGTSKSGDSLVTGTRTGEELLGRGATSTWYGKVRLRLGSWSSVEYSFQEYVYIENNTYGDSAATVPISGWKIRNRGRYTGTPEEVTIPQGINIWVANSNNKLEAIKLAPGERAVVTTGRVVSSDPYQLPTAMRINKCAGYLNDAGSYQFLPYLNNNCNYPEREPGAQETLNDTCLNFIKRELGTCRTVKFNEYGGLIGLGTEEVNDREEKKRVVRLDQACLTYLKNHYNYNSCVAVHKKDADFFSPREWRIWLGNSRKFYAPDRETITLLDSRGKVVDQISY